MNINTFEKLQLNEVKELIKNYCVSSLGKELIEKTNPSGNFNIVKRRLNENKSYYRKSGKRNDTRAK